MSKTPNNFEWVWQSSHTQFHPGYDNLKCLVSNIPLLCRSLHPHSFYAKKYFQLSKAKGKVHNISYSLLKRCQNRWHFLGSCIMWRDPVSDLMRSNSLFTQVVFNILGVLWSLYVDGGKLLLVAVYYYNIYMTNIFLLFCYYYYLLFFLENLQRSLGLGTACWIYIACPHNLIKRWCKNNWE